MHDSSMHACPVMLEDKIKDSLIGEISYINDTNKQEDPLVPFKVYLKNCN